MLPNFDCSTHPAAPVVKRVWMGRGPDIVNDGITSDWAAPNEPIAEMGCPGAWYRTAWCRSLDPYHRRIGRNGERVDNPALTRCEDPLVLAAVLALEAFEDAAAAEASRLYYAEQARKAKASKP